jgi:hypothetical protein
MSPATYVRITWASTVEMVWSINQRLHAKTDAHTKNFISFSDLQASLLATKLHCSTFLHCNAYLLATVLVHTSFPLAGRLRWNPLVQWWTERRQGSEHKSYWSPIKSGRILKRGMAQWCRLWGRQQSDWYQFSRTAENWKFVALPCNLDCSRKRLHSFSYVKNHDHSW